MKIRNKVLTVAILSILLGVSGDFIITNNYGPIKIRGGLVYGSNRFGGGTSSKIYEISEINKNTSWTKPIVVIKTVKGKFIYGGYDDDQSASRVAFKLSLARFDANLANWRRKAASLCLLYGLPWKKAGEPHIVGGGGDEFSVEYLVTYNSERGILRCKMNSSAKVLEYGVY